MNVLIIGSRKFYEPIEECKSILKSKGIDAYTPEKPKGDLTYEQELEAELRFWRLVKKCDLIYVYSQEGYIGDTVKREIAYCYSCSKNMASNEVVDDKFSAELIGRNSIMDLEQLIKLADIENKNKQKNSKLYIAA